jgi:exodeoxyribonuclease VII small subunit
MNDTPKPASPETLEGAMERLEAVVQGMETGGLPLETLIEHYEEGVGLVKFCQQKLDAAEKRIQIITRNAKGEIILQDFESENAEA